MQLALTKSQHQSFVESKITVNVGNEDIEVKKNKTLMFKNTKENRALIIDVLQEEIE